MTIDKETMDKCIKILKSKDLGQELQIELIGSLLETSNVIKFGTVPTVTPVPTTAPAVQPWGPTWVYSQWEPSKKLDTEITCDTK